MHIELVNSDVDELLNDNDVILGRTEYEPPIWDNAPKPKANRSNPSDHISMQSYYLPAATGGLILPANVVNVVRQQAEGAGARVTLSVLSTLAAGVVTLVLLAHPEDATGLVLGGATATRQYLSSGFAYADTAPLVVNTRAALWAVNPHATQDCVLSVMVETYNPYVGE